MGVLIVVVMFVMMVVLLVVGIGGGGMLCFVCYMVLKYLCVDVSMLVMSLFISWYF